MISAQLVSCRQQQQQQQQQHQQCSVVSMPSIFLLRLAQCASLATILSAYEHPADETARPFSGMVLNHFKSAAHLQWQKLCQRKLKQPKYYDEPRIVRKLR
jgi:hypothetical protein